MAKPKLVNLLQTSRMFADAGLTIAKRTIINRMHAGTWPIKPVRFGRKIYFHQEHVQKYIQHILDGGKENGTTSDES